MAPPSYRLLAVDQDGGALALYRDVLTLEREGAAALEALFSDSGSPFADVMPAPRTAPGPTEDDGPRFDVSLCDEAAAALAALESALAGDAPFAVAFVDVDLGGRGRGIDLGARLRALDPAVEIVMVAAGSDVVVRELNARISPSEKLLYLQKPLRAQELRQLARSLCAKWSADRQLKVLNENLLEMVEARTAELNEINLQLTRDISERMRMLRELRASEERYRLLFEEDITGNFVAGADGRIVACNRSFARIFGYDSVEEAKAFNVFEFAGWDKGFILSAKPEELKIENLEAVYNGRDGKQVNVIGNFEGKFATTGELSEIRGYFFDITERKKLEEKLRLAQKMEALGTLAGGIAHDFNNILGVIMGYAEILMENSGDNPGMVRRIREIVNAGQRAKDLVTQILNFSRQGVHERKPLKLAPLLKEALKMLRSTLPASVEVRQIIMGEEDLVLADPTQMHQILLNLCGNAAHAMREQGGLLTVSLADVHLDDEAARISPELTPGGYVRLTVSDTGTGMRKEVLERIFDPFFTTKKPGEGTGMGLSVVHGIVKNHGGAILVQSEPGLGSTFHVFLPKTDLLAEPELKSVTDFVPGPATVLLVDDEKALVDIGREMLESLGFAVVARTSSVEALEAFRNRPEEFDVVVTDQTMPNLSGVEMAREMLKTRPNLPVILCSGFSEAVAYDRMQALGIREYVLKPILKRRLVEAISRALAPRDDQKA